MAGTNRTNNLRHAPVFAYIQPLWGDLIYGTKDQLQSIGIAAGMAFPGEPNGPKRSLRVTDPRGLAAKVEAATWQGEGIFSVSISFPGRERPSYVSAFAPGVKKEEFIWGDSYTGAALSLVAAGLITYDRLPGQPGMRKTRVTILPDGSLSSGAPTANHGAGHKPGAICITRKSKATYCVDVTLPNHEQERRREDHARGEREWEARMKSLPRPEPLCVTSTQRQEIQAARDLMGSWHKSADTFRNSAFDHADLILGMLESKLIDGAEGGYRLSDDAARRFEGLVDEMIELIKTQRIVMDHELRNKHTPACLAKEVLRSDAAYAGSPIQYGGNVVPFRRESARS